MVDRYRYDLEVDVYVSPSSASPVASGEESSLTFQELVVMGWPFSEVPLWLSRRLSFRETSFLNLPCSLLLGSTRLSAQGISHLPLR